MRFDALPADMRDIVEALVLFTAAEGGGLIANGCVVPVDLPIVDVALDDVPEVPLADPEADGDDRGVDHARAMDPARVPPIVIADGLLLDGRHRVWRSRDLGLATIQAVDLTGIADPSAARNMCLAWIGPQGPPPSP